MERIDYHVEGICRQYGYDEFGSVMSQTDLIHVARSQALGFQIFDEHLKKDNKFASSD
jgi:hypothetical protein